MSDTDSKLCVFMGVHLLQYVNSVLDAIGGKMSCDYCLVDKSVLCIVY